LSTIVFTSSGFIVSWRAAGVVWTATHERGDRDQADSDLLRHRFLLGGCTHRRSGHEVEA
jgi:hypothetical protein